MAIALLFEKVLTLRLKSPVCWLKNLVTTTPPPETSWNSQLM
nr:MAG TPA: hypothetical protein [Caudoviricetes sp.]